MRLAPGHEVSHYRLVEKIGEGGMGVVWKAEDANLHRPVALKFLTAESFKHGDRRARFLREARLAASLNHPHICTVYEVGEAPAGEEEPAPGAPPPSGTPFISMELVEGRSLAEILRERGALPLKETLRTAVQVAEALVAAHSRGIAHRDLKPGNVMITREGLVKVLDFGLAKPLAPAGADEARVSEAETISEELTRQGLVVGTAAYMSPEQAKGEAVDTRSDVFSFGILLYEMIAGARPFRGQTSSATRLKIIEDDPAPLPPGTEVVPADLERILLRCLRKNPEERYNDTRDLAVALRDLLEETTSGRQRKLSAGDRRDRSVTRKRVLVVVVVVIVGLAGIAAWLELGPGRPPPPPVFSHKVRRVTSGPGREITPSLSPDGRVIVYAARGAEGDWDILSQRVEGTRTLNLTGDSRADDLSPAFSPDGEWIAFRSDRDGGGIFIMGATGESTRRLTDFGADPAWSPGGDAIAFSTDVIDDPSARGVLSELWVVEVESGETRRVYEGDAVQPHWSPHGHRITFWGIRGGESERDIWTIPATGGRPVAVTRDPAVDWSPVWSPDGGHLYFSSDRGGSMNLWRVAIDEETGEILGDPEPVTAGGTASRGRMSLNAAGTRLAYTEELNSRLIRSVEFDPRGEVVIGEMGEVTSGSVETRYPDVSPDGEWIAYMTFGTNQDLFVIRADGSGRRQLTDDVYKDWCPRWTPDGGRIVFHTNRQGTFEIWSIRPDGSDLRAHTDLGGNGVTNPVVSPDGKQVAYYSWTENNGGLVGLEGGAPRSLPPIEEGVSFYPSSWSPDGRMLVGTGWEMGPPYRGIFSFSVETESYRRLTDGGSFARWMSDSRRIVFDREGVLMLMDIESGREKEILSRKPFSSLSNPSISTDDRFIYLVENRLESDLWVLEAD